MSIQKKTVGATLATAAAAMFIAGAAISGAPSAAQADGFKCAGINACKGHGGCAGAANACKGKNGCKGQGWVSTKDAAECTSKGGKPVKS
ncbi:MAG: hypothetical protein WD075_14155 [Rhodospirillales bacterium]